MVFLVILLIGWFIANHGVAAAIARAVKDRAGGALGGLSYGRTLANIAAVVIIGVIAALNQIGMATTVTTPILITVLATIGGIAVVEVPQARAEAAAYQRAWRPPSGATEAPVPARRGGPGPRPVRGQFLVGWRSVR